MRKFATPGADTPGSSGNKLLESALSTWKAPGAPLTVKFRVLAMEAIQREVIEGFKALPKRGAEVGGLLLGTVEDAKQPVIAIEDFEPVPCEYRFGPSFHLSETDRQILEESLSWFRGGSHAGLTALGFYRSHTRYGFFWSEEDQKLFSSYFPEPGNLFLLIKPIRLGHSVADFSVWDQGKLKELATPVRFPFGLPPIEEPQVGAGPVEEQPAPQVQPIVLSPASLARESVEAHTAAPVAAPFDAPQAFSLPELIPSAGARSSPVPVSFSEPPSEPEPLSSREPPSEPETLSSREPFSAPEPPSPRELPFTPEPLAPREPSPAQPFHGALPTFLPPTRHPAARWLWPALTVMFFIIGAVLAYIALRGGGETSTELAHNSTTQSLPPPTPQASPIPPEPEPQKPSPSGHASSPQLGDTQTRSRIGASGSADRAGPPVATARDRAVKRQVQTFLSEWARALKRGDVESYVDSYAPRLTTYFTRRNVSHAEVRKSVEQMIKRYGRLDIYKITDLQVTPAGRGKAIATFRKRWQTSGRKKFAGEERERLMLAKADGSWEITSEEEEKLYWVHKER